MALKAMMLRKKIDAKKTELAALKEREADLQKREADLETAIDEAETDEEKATVEEAVDEFDRDKTELDASMAGLTGEISKLEAELAEEEKKQAEPGEERAEETVKNVEVREMHDYRTDFYGMSRQERDSFFARDDVKGFLSEMRDCITQKRAITNQALIIPEVMLPLLRQKVEEASKLIGRVNLKPVSGTARENIMGTIPEAVWTEMVANLNELSLGFNNVEVDGFKVGGFFAIANAILQDNDVNLATIILDTLGKSIGKALDKAIVYGTGTKMPIGFVTRLAQTSEPATYPSTARTWVDLHTSNIATGTTATGLAVFKEIIANSKAIVNDYFDSNITWIMNHKTHMDLMIHSMDKNSNAAIVAGMNNTMPVIGGEIVELPFMADENIAYGYLDAYLLAERQGTSIAQSEHVRFTQDQTVFRGLARYDGTPVIAEAFGLLTLNAASPVTTATFPSDTAN